MQSRGLFIIIVTCHLIFAFPSSRANSQNKTDSSDLVSWIKEMGGEYDQVEDGPNKPIVRLRLDRTRGIDPGFTPDSLKDEDLRRLAELTELEELTLEYRHALTDRGLRYLTSLENLRSLNLSRTSINGMGINYLVALDQLRELDLSSCHQLTNESMAHVKKLQQITSLRLDATSTRGSSDSNWSMQLQLMASMPQSPHASQLDELRGGITDAGLLQLVGMPNLKQISLRMTKVTDKGVRELGPLNQLEYLDISQTAISDESLDTIAQLKQLKTLKLNFVALSDMGLRKLASLEQLEELELRGTPIGTPGVRELSRLPNLRRLDLSMTRVDETVLDELLSLTNLDDVELGQTQQRFHGVFRFAERHPNFTLKTMLLSSELATANSDGEIISLTLNGREVDDNTLSLIEGYKQLEVLNLDGTNVTDQGLVHLQVHSNLKNLSLADTSISFKGLHDLFLVKQQRTLGEFFDIVGVRRRADQSADNEENFLDLSGRSIDGADLSWIAGYAPATSLFLHENPITNAGFEHLARLKNLRRLWISGTQLTGESLAAFGPSDLRELFLTDTSVSDDDLQILAQNCKNLQVVNLCGTLKSDEAVQHLVGLRNLKVLIVDADVLSQQAINELRLAKPMLELIESQATAISAIRGKPRVFNHMPTGNSRVVEMGAVRSTIPEHPLIRVYGDAYFERANTIYGGGDVGSRRRWSELKSVEAIDIVNATNVDGIPQALGELPQLKRITFYRSNVRDADLAHLSSLRNLESLDLKRTTISSRGLVHIRPLLSLKKLSIGEDPSKITDDGIEHLAGLINLEELDLSRSNITDAALVHLKNLKNLKSLSMREVRVNEGLQHLGELPNLERLDLSSTFLSDATAKFLCSCKNLKSIDASSTLLSQAGIDHIRESLPNVVISVGQLMSPTTRHALEPLAKLRVELWIDWKSEVSMIDLRRLEAISGVMPSVLELRDSLKYLRLGKHATDELLSQLREFPKLEGINLSESKVTSVGLIYLQDCPKLNCLVFQRCNLDKACLGSIGNLLNLQELFLDGSSFPEEAFETISSMPHMQRLFLAKTTITDGNLLQLVKLKKLTHLRLDHTNVTSRGLEHLKAHAELQELSLVGTHITDSDIQSLREAIPECTFILQ